MAKNKMSDEHKAAIVTGQKEATAVRQYLEALLGTKPKPGRRRSPEQTAARIEEISEQLTDDGLKAIRRLELIRDRSDLQASLEALRDEPDMQSLEGAFVEHAAGFSERKGIKYAHWREFGVSADILRRAGITRGS